MNIIPGSTYGQAYQKEREIFLSGSERSLGRGKRVKSQTR